MSKTEQVNVRIESEVKKAAEMVFEKLGLTPSQAVNLFYRKAALQQGLPFTINIPNRETLARISHRDPEFCDKLAQQVTGSLAGA